MSSMCHIPGCTFPPEEPLICEECKRPACAKHAGMSPDKRVLCVNCMPPRDGRQ